MEFVGPDANVKTGRCLVRLALWKTKISHYTNSDKRLAMHCRKDLIHLTLRTQNAMC